MKKIAGSVFLLLLWLACTVPVFSQTQSVFTTETDHFRVQSEVSPLHAADTAARMEAMLVFFNSYFRFDLSALRAKLQVRIFAKKAQFDEYISSVIQQKRDDFVYIHYQNPEKSILVGFYDPANPRDTSLSHQSFIQYLKAFIASPPLWIREGFAVYFEKIAYNRESGRIVFRENQAWLDTVKTLARTTPDKFVPASQMLTIDLESARQNIDVFYPETWAMIDFMVGTSEKAYTRALWDSIRFLKADATLEENTERLNRFVFNYLDADAAAKSFISYFTAKRSFRELMQEGSELYSKGDFKGAEDRFLKAVSAEEGQYLPYYYLGLVSYEKKDHAMAEYYYKTALQMGCNLGLANYALGINAFASKNTVAAKDYLIKARDDSSGEYRKKAEEILLELNR